MQFCCCCLTCGYLCSLVLLTKFGVEYKHVTTGLVDSRYFLCLVPQDTTWSKFKIYETSSSALIVLDTLRHTCCLGISGSRFQAVIHTDCEMPFLRSLARCLCDDNQTFAAFASCAHRRRSEASAASVSPAASGFSASAGGAVAADVASTGGLLGPRAPAA